MDINFPLLKLNMFTHILLIVLDLLEYNVDIHTY